jgi:hypothetical protein
MSIGSFLNKWGFTIFFLSFFFSCDKEKIKKIDCYDFGLNGYVDISKLNSIIKLEETLFVKIEIPFQSINDFTAENIEIGKFNSLWGGLKIVRYISDSMANGNINTPGAIKSFKYATENNIFEIPENLGQPSTDALFFRYQKGTNTFSLNLKVIPFEKGTYQIQFLSSGFRDASCFNRINHIIRNYRNTDYTFLLEQALGRPFGRPDEYYPFNYNLKVE